MRISLGPECQHFPYIMAFYWLPSPSRIKFLTVVILRLFTIWYGSTYLMAPDLLKQPASPKPTALLHQLLIERSKAWWIVTRPLKVRFLYKVSPNSSIQNCSLVLFSLASLSRLSCLGFGELICIGTHIDPSLLFLHALLPFCGHWTLNTNQTKKLPTKVSSQMNESKG